MAAGESPPDGSRRSLEARRDPAFSMRLYARLDVAAAGLTERRFPAYRDG